MDASNDTEMLWTRLLVPYSDETTMGRSEYKVLVENASPTIMSGQLGSAVRATIIVGEATVPPQ